MAGRFMDKETLEAEAARLNVDLAGLTWPQKQGAVLAALKVEELENLDNGDIFSPVEINLRDEGSDDDFLEVTPGEPVHVHVNSNDPMEPMRGKNVMICPEMALTANQLFGYEEELDEDIMVEEVHHDVDAAYRAGLDLVTGTYTVTGQTGKKVVAHTALPKQGCGITFTPDRDLVPVVTSRGRKGYLWTHHRLPNVKQLLLESGYYETYRHRFQDEPFIWHASSKLLACDINLVHSIIREIETKEQERRIRDEQNRKFIEEQLGM